jgi:hypothetical protein
MGTARKTETYIYEEKELTTQSSANIKKLSAVHLKKSRELFSAFGVHTVTT